MAHFLTNIHHNGSSLIILLFFSDANWTLAKHSEKIWNHVNWMFLPHGITIGCDFIFNKLHYFETVSITKNGATSILPSVCTLNNYSLMRKFIINCLFSEQFFFQISNHELQRFNSLLRNIIPSVSINLLMKINVK